MITESFDNTTEPIINMEEFYGRRKQLLDICLVIFSKSIYETILEMYTCRQIAEIYAVNGVTPIYCFTYEKKTSRFICRHSVLPAAHRTLLRRTG